MKSRFALLLLLLSPLFAHAATPVAGVDYVEIPNGKPFAPLNGKVEVVEVFGYTCIHCAHFQPQVAAWKRKQPVSYTHLDVYKRQGTTQEKDPVLFHIMSQVSNRLTDQEIQSLATFLQGLHDRADDAAAASTPAAAPAPAPAALSLIHI